MKKRTIIVVALAIVLALSFATIATAKYAGSFRGEATTLSGEPIAASQRGYLSWSGANALFGSTQVTAHGGYTTASVKCAVCHSAHRAAAAPATEDWHLTSGPGTCVNCHSTWGAGGATKKIEWANPNGGASNPTSANSGPHNSFNCVNSCHTNGIHGFNTSPYHGNAVYLLGGTAVVDDAIAAALSAGNVSANLTATGSDNNAGWFVGGTTGVPVDGSRPTGSDSQFAAAKAMATGYTCNQTDCHTNSQFAVNNWGWSQDRLDAVDSSTVALTGHATGAWNHNGGANCGPCHPGSPSGGYRYSSGTGAIAAALDLAQTKSVNLSKAYGCDQCHDMVGVATNTTAWPHANRNISVYEWDTFGAIQTINAQASGNLWMYSYQIGTSSGTPATFSATDRNNNFRVVNGAVGGSDVGTIKDGVCLKCHVAIDATTLAADTGAFSTTGANMNISGRQHNTRLSTTDFGVWTGSNRTPSASPSTNPAQYTGSKVVFLWK